MGGRSTTSSSPRPVVGADAPAQGGRTGRGPAAGGRRRGRAESPPNASVEGEPARHHAITSPAPRGRPSPGRRAPRVDRLPGLPVPARRVWNHMLRAGVLFAAGDTTQAVVAMTGQADLAARPGLVQQ